MGSLLRSFGLLAHTAESVSREAAAGAFREVAGSSPKATMDRPAFQKAVQLLIADLPASSKCETARKVEARELAQTATAKEVGERGVSKGSSGLAQGGGFRVGWRHICGVPCRGESEGGSRGMVEERQGAEQDMGATDGGLETRASHRRNEELVRVLQELDTSRAFAQPSIVSARYTLTRHACSAKAAPG